MPRWGYVASAFVLFLIGFFGFFLNLMVILLMFKDRQNSQRLGRVNRAEARVTAMVLLMIISFTVSWTPYSLFALMEQFATEGIVSPGAGVIPALVAKSSICYDPLIYVGMNTQFRQSIKHVFSMQTKCRNSETKREDMNSFLSPNHKLSVLNDTALRNSSEIFTLNRPKKVSKCNTNSDDKINITINEKANKQLQKVSKLCLIEEKQSVSDAERSGETIFDDDTSNSNRKLEKSCILNDQSPVLTIVDANKLCFTKVAKRENEKQLYEELFTEVKKIDNTDQSFKRPKTLKHSYSLDLGSISHEGKRRKFSIETKLESIVVPKSFMGKVMSKFFEQNGKQNKIKTYLCEKQDNQGNEELT
ncbi:Opsin-VA [Papilio machaon]|uniref:Opsin-VA n=1 Tax=Papilio machaon TaxID=76193 RepID=A0A194QSV9_PAPMA|nr:Opsin-VA [Papilio machaon]